MYALHVTAPTNIIDITRQGLLVQAGQRALRLGDDMPGVWLFADWAALESAMVIGMFDEPSTLAILLIDITDLDVERSEHHGEIGEIVSRAPIAADRVNVICHDMEDDAMFDAAKRHAVAVLCASTEAGACRARERAH